MSFMVLHRDGFELPGLGLSIRGRHAARRLSTFLRMLRRHPHWSGLLLVAAGAYCAEGRDQRALYCGEFSVVGPEVKCKEAMFYACYYLSTKMLDGFDALDAANQMKLIQNTRPLFGDAVMFRTEEWVREHNAQQSLAGSYPKIGMNWINQTHSVSDLYIFRQVSINAFLDVVMLMHNAHLQCIAPYQNAVIRFFDQLMHANKMILDNLLPLPIINACSAMITPVKLLDYLGKLTSVIAGEYYRRGKTAPSSQSPLMGLGFILLGLLAIFFLAFRFSPSSRSFNKPQEPVKMINFLERLPKTTDYGEVFTDGQQSHEGQKILESTERRSKAMRLLQDYMNQYDSLSYAEFSVLYNLMELFYRHFLETTSTEDVKVTANELFDNEFEDVIDTTSMTLPIQCYLLDAHNVGPLTLIRLYKNEPQKQGSIRSMTDKTLYLPAAEIHRNIHLEKRLEGEFKGEKLKKAFTTLFTNIKAAEAQQAQASKPKTH